MKVFTNQQLENHLREKGIKLKRGDGNLFSKFDYFQVINAYKYLFLKGEENIDDIFKNIDNNIDIERYEKNYSITYISTNDFKNKICNKIIEKYGLKEDARSNLNEKVNVINSIKYTHHIYDENSYYNDFVRMYLFEHNLRNTLLKYVLKIEENIKRIFIKTLNDKQVSDNFLLNFDNYNVSGKNSSYDHTISSIKEILTIYGRRKSKPIEHKIQQEIGIPYWIIINELTLNQTLSIISNLKYELKYAILQEITNEFTINTYDIFKSQTSNQRQKGKNDIDNFFSILKSIANFRNLLAHNQPIYNYNVLKFNSQNKTCEYEYPKTNMKKQCRLNEQYRLNEQLFVKMQRFYGFDNYNKVVHNRNLDLSYIIYNVYKINQKIDKTILMLKEITQIYYDFNIFEFEQQYKFESIEQLAELKEYISKIDLYNNSDNIISNIENNKAYKKELKNEIQNYSKALQQIKKLVSKLNKEEITKKYGQLFRFHSTYSFLTGIDRIFFNKIK